MCNLTKKDIRIGWVSYHLEGVSAINSMLRSNYHVAAMFTLKPHRLALKSGSYDYQKIAKENSVPFYQIDSINDPETVTVLRSLKLDFLFVIGWGQLVSSSVLNLFPIGVVGAHASMLPKYRGAAPVNWALINGEKFTGNTLIWLNEEIDQGDIIDQEVFEITRYDDCASIYEKVASTNERMIMKLLPVLQAGERPGIQQKNSDQPLMPRRKPEDGNIDWTKSAYELYNFIRALTRPYPGAYTFFEGKKCFIWKVGVEKPAINIAQEPGKIVAVNYGHSSETCSILVACRGGFLQIFEISLGANIIFGNELANDIYIGKNFGGQ